MGIIIAHLVVNCKHLFAFSNFPKSRDCRLADGEKDSIKNTLWPAPFAAVQELIPPISHHLCLRPSFRPLTIYALRHSFRPLTFHTFRHFSLYSIRPFPSWTAAALSFFSARMSRRACFSRRTRFSRCACFSRCTSFSRRTSFSRCASLSRCTSFTTPAAFSTLPHLPSFRHPILI